MFGYKLTRQGRVIVGFIFYAIITTILIVIHHSADLITAYIVTNIAFAVLWLAASLEEDYQVYSWSELSWYSNVFLLLFAGPIILCMLCWEQTKIVLPYLVEKDTRKKKRKNEEIIEKPYLDHDICSYRSSESAYDFLYSTKEITYKLPED